VDLDEVLDQRAALVARLAVRGDRGHDRRDAVSREEVRHEPDPQDVRVAVLLREAEPFGEVRPDDVAVEELDLHAAPTDLRQQHLGERRLPGPGEAGEPDRETLLLGGGGHRKLLPIVPSGGSTPYRERIEGPTSRSPRPS